MPQNNTIKKYENGWNQQIILGLSSALWGVLTLGLAFMANNVIANDKERIITDQAIMEKVNKNAVAIAELRSIKDDINEIKTILRRSVPHN